MTESDQLKGRDHYIRWREWIKNLLILCDVDKIVDGQHTKPEEHTRDSRLWEEKDIWAGAFIRVTLQDHVCDSVLYLTVSGREVWLELEKRYKPKGWPAARKFLDNFERVTYSPQLYTSVSAFREAIFTPVYHLEKADLGFQIPDWIWEKRFIDCTQAVHGPILETYLMAQESRELEHDSTRRVMAMSEIIQMHEDSQARKRAMHQDQAA